MQDLASKAGVEDAIVRAVCVSGWGGGQCRERIEHFGLKVISICNAYKQHCPLELPVKMDTLDFCSFYFVPHVAAEQSGGHWVLRSY